MSSSPAQEAAEPAVDHGFRGVACPVCGSTAHDPQAVGQERPFVDGDPTYLFVRCRDCTLLYLNPVPAELATSTAAHSESTARIEACARRLAALAPGIVVAESEASAVPATLDEAPGGHRRLYVAGGLERAENPCAFIADLGLHLHPEGELVVLVSNADSALMRVFGRRHASLYAFPSRRQLFGVDSLRVLASRIGFEIEDATTCPDRSAWARSVRNFLADWWRGTVRAPDDRGIGGLRQLLGPLEAASARSGNGAILVMRLRGSGRATVGERTEDGLRRPGGPAIVGREAPVAILGAGVAGLTAAKLLREHDVDVKIFEAGSQIAGLAQSFRDEEGFSHDFGAHFITNRFAAALGVGSRCRTVHHYGEAVRAGGRTFSYPFGLARHPPFALSAAWRRLRSAGAPAPESASELYEQLFGPRLARDVAIPLAEAWSGVSANDLAPSVRPPQLDRGIAHVLKLKISSRLSGRAVANGFSRAQPENPHVFHVYPDHGVSVLTSRLAEGLGDEIELNSRVEAVYTEDDRVVGIRVAGTDHDASTVISTAPVHVLPRLVRGSEALAPLSRFRYRAFTLVNMRFATRPLLPDVITWIPERAYTFFRLSEAPRAMPWLAPEGKTIVTVDIGCEVGDEIWTMDEETLGQRCLAELDDLFPGARRAYMGCQVLRTPVAHAVYLREYEEERRRFAGGLPVAGLYSVGRNGEFAHILMEDVYWRTRERIHEMLRAAGSRHAARSGVAPT